MIRALLLFLKFIKKIFNIKDFCSNKDYADASMIDEEERQYYHEDSYYKLVFNKGSIYESRLETFEQMKKHSSPSKRGLYVPEILMLSFCYKFPTPKNGYPAYWWFRYGVRDVGSLLKSLEERGFIKINPQTGKYMTTKLGEAEKKDYEFIEYTHKNSDTSNLTAWDMMELVKDNSSCDWMTIFCERTGKARPIERSEKLDRSNLSKSKKDIKDRIPVSQIKNQDDFDKGFDLGYPHFIKGEQLRKLGYTFLAIEEFDKARAIGYDAPALYWSYAMAFRKIKDYDNEVEILDEAFQRKIVSNEASRFVERKKKAELLKNKIILS